MPQQLIHVAHIMPSLGFGGAERCVVDIINNASPHFRHTIVLFSDSHALFNEITSPTAHLVVVPKRGRLSLGFFGELCDTLRRIKPDIVHTHLFGPDVWGRISARFLGLPVITTEHNLNYGEGILKNYIKRCLRNLSAQYVACSESVRRYMIKTYKVRQPVTVIRYGINLNRFASVPPPAFRPVPRLLMLGRLVPQKGHDIALIALAQLASLPWRLTIVGEGELEAELKKMVEQLGIKDRVAFLPPTHAIPGLFAEHDVLLMPSRWEGLGIVVMEAMAAGRPVVASRRDGLAELMQDKVTGFYVDSVDSGAWAGQLQWCLEHTTECQVVGKAARQFALNTFGVDRMVKAYESLYQLVTDR